MKLFKMFALGFCILSLASCDLGGTGSGNGGEQIVEKNKIDLNLFEKCKDIRFSSYQSGSETSLTHYLKQIAPYDDSYKVKTNKYTTCSLYNAKGE